MAELVEQADTCHVGETRRESNDNASSNEQAHAVCSGSESGADNHGDRAVDDDGAATEAVAGV